VGKVNGAFLIQFAARSRTFRKSPFFRDESLAQFRIVSPSPAPVKNGSEAAGSRRATLGTSRASCNSNPAATSWPAIWAGPLGKARPVTGTWRNGYIELSFDAELGNPANPIIAPAILAGWIDGDAGSDRMSVLDRTDGRWTAVRKP
jgi:hypothetical protein